MTARSGRQATFTGEGGTDRGGLFRESLREMCAELQSDGPLRLLLPTPNARRALAGAATEWLVNAALRDAEHLAMYEFLGTLMGAALRRGASLDLDLSPLVWKPLLAQAPTWADLAAADHAFCAWITAGRAATEAEWAAGRRVWTVATAAGPRAELRRGGASQVVGYSEREAYLAACTAHRLREGRRQASGAPQGRLPTRRGPG